MSRIHPGKDKYSTEEQRATGPPTVSTVWKKSSMGFQGTDGFTVFDSNGNIAFRVDNYTRNSRCLTNGPVHKDGTGAALFTLCPKIFSIHEQWEGFRGEACRKRRQRRPFFSIRRCSVFQREDKRMFAWVLQRNRASSDVFLMDHVFSMAIKPGHDHAFIMAFVVVLDRISQKPYTPALSC
ncbi:hypothetical protein AMTR_s00077p00185350 [Amborella trichopoda]|uniref:Uncharacterized protein n=2 Tax=Amborella trichopoda TaxID=13333 RepID=W1P383_AMBTC|nr:hypothetical protein AMTR_s00077p00185350 [Amborella trichopoda]